MKESWLSDGDCSTCRKKYCKKSCSMQKKKRQAYISSAINSSLSLIDGGFKK